MEVLIRTSVSSNNNGPRAAFSVEDEPPDGVESHQAELGKSIVLEPPALCSAGP